MTCGVYESYYGGLGGYSRVPERNEERAQSAQVYPFINPKRICVQGWAAWYRAAAEGAWS